ncbi:MAG: hypothetical protein Q9159_006699 [Coniocarpon cinnabarinum]
MARRQLHHEARAKPALNPDLTHFKVSISRQHNVKFVVTLPKVSTAHSEGLRKQWRTMINEIIKKDKLGPPSEEQATKNGRERLVVKSQVDKDALLRDMIAWVEKAGMKKASWALLRGKQKWVAEDGELVRSQWENQRVERGTTNEARMETTGEGQGGEQERHEEEKPEAKEQGYFMSGALGD